MCHDVWICICYHKLHYNLGWTKDDCPDEAKLDKLGDNMAKSIYEVYNYN